jgi:hypothetical protein
MKMRIDYELAFGSVSRLGGGEEEEEEEVVVAAVLNPW